MSPRSISDLALDDVPLLRVDDTVFDAVQQLFASQLPALPVVDQDGIYKGVFGEREFMQARFPSYLNHLHGTAFLPRSLDDALETRDTCRYEPVGLHMNTEHIDVGPDFADTQVAELFLHHRVLAIPVVAEGQVKGVIMRQDFFRAVAQRFLDGGTLA